MSERTIGILGAGSLVGEPLVDLAVARGWRVCAYSRRPVPEGAEARPGVSWLLVGEPPPAGVTHWVSLIPIGILVEHFPLLSGAGRIVALSSTSVFTKERSSDQSERELVRTLLDGEERLAAWAATQGTEWIVLRPTLIYGFGRDHNVCAIAQVIRKLGFFPLFGPALGRRQPVYAKDVALACISALDAGCANRSFDLSGSETLTFRDMVDRVFRALGRRERVIKLPLWAFRLAASSANLVAGRRRWSPAMAERMNQDLVFDHGEASRELGFAPRPFDLDRADLGL